jgi:hypothetical protein
MSSFLEKFLKIDRRWIFLAVGLAVIIALVSPCQMSTTITPPVQTFYNVVDAATPDKPLIVSMDVGPSTLPELEPMIKATLRHAFSNNIKVVGLTLLLTGPSIGERLLVDTAAEMNAEFEAAGDDRRIVQGEDWVFLGFRAGVQAVILGMGEEIRNVFPVDYYGTFLDDLPMMKNLHNYDDMSSIVTISGTALPESWVAFAGAPYDIPVSVGVTAVSASNYYAYVQTGQMAGLLGGLKGAAEYERLINYPGMASKGMVAQFWVHMIIVFFIVLGNIAFFITRAQKKRQTDKK